MARPHQRWPQNETLAPQDSHNEYFSVQICTYGCKWPATKNEGMAEHQPLPVDFVRTHPPAANRLSRLSVVDKFKCHDRHLRTLFSHLRYPKTTDIALDDI
jgi:hypothetical protein